MSIYDTLNPEQRKAVEHNEGPLLILAGAGSGKTRVLTHRIAYLMDKVGINPWNILALTFTNKAASEMRERVDHLIGYGAENIWVSTFHSTCVRILRKYIDRLGYSNSFTIYDADDQKTLMREICKYLDIDTKQLKERTLLSVISSAKDELITPDAYLKNASGDFKLEKYATVYKEYQKRLQQNNALDFDELICKTVELLQKNPDVLEYYQNRFRYIMVDEYQDTNTAQFRLISILATTTNPDGKKVHNLCVVGDDDQSIYKFRGANIYNILNFEKEYANTKVIKLEQNYRSTKNILTAANEVIANNTERKEKALWTDNEEGDTIYFTQFDTEYMEAEHIATDISNGVNNENLNYNDFAILYRTNAQSRILEEKLVQRNIPYKIVGGVNFYQRKEIKDLLAYLRTINNSMDDISTRRIINTPKRGIGLTTVDRVTDYSLKNGMSFYDALKHADTIPGLGRGASKISPFISLIEILKSKLSLPTYSLMDLMEEIMEATGYVAELEAENTIEAKSRIENIEELKNKIVTYMETSDTPTLNEFLEDVALVADIDTMEDSTNVVILMTLHSAKGLEFPFVYMCGMEDGIFPGYMSITADDPGEIEEERRLCYVGITRAMKKLSLSAARQRMHNGETRFNKPSRFIYEIPRYLLQQTNGSDAFRPNTSSVTFERVGSATTTNAPRFSSDNRQIRGAITPTSYRGPGSRNHNNLDNPFSGNPFIQKGFGDKNESSSRFHATGQKQMKSNPLDKLLAYKVGDSVNHKKFGEGIVLDIQKGTKDYEITVEFPTTGKKKMLAAFAKLEKIS